MSVGYDDPIEQYRKWLFASTGNDPELAKYLLIGKFVAEVASLENQLDEAILVFSDQVLRWNPEIAEKEKCFSNFPSQYKGKIDFTIAIFVWFPIFRCCGDVDDVLDLNALGYILDESTTTRNIVAHGDILFTESFGQSFIIRVSKWERDKSKKNSFRLVQYKYGCGNIIQQIINVSYARKLIRQIVSICEGKDVGRERREYQRLLADNRELGMKLSEIEAEVMSIGTNESSH